MQLRKSGYDPEGFPYCPSDKHSELEQLTTELDIAAFIENQRCRPVTAQSPSERKQCLEAG